MDKQALLAALAGTLDGSPVARQQSEQQLHRFEEMSGFTAYLLDLVADGDAAAVQTSAAILFKNRVASFWRAPEHRKASPRYIQADEREHIKARLIPTLCKVYKTHLLRVQLCSAVRSVLDMEKWAELDDTVAGLLQDDNANHVFTGLLCLAEYTRAYSYTGLDGSRPNVVVDGLATRNLPVLERLAQGLVLSGASDEMLYLIFKIFKYFTLTSLPLYLSSSEHLGTWCQLHLSVVSAPLPPLLKGETLHPRVKATKWGFANLYQLLFRHGGGSGTLDSSPLKGVFVASFVPGILGVYWKLVEQWSAGQVWFSGAALYHLIGFMEQLLKTLAYPLVEEKLEALLRHVVLPSLSALPELIELYNDEPEEYVRTYFALYRDDPSPDTALVNFVFGLSSFHFDLAGPVLLRIIQEAFARRSADRSSTEGAVAAEGALRMLATISHMLDTPASPVAGRMDQLVYSTIYPELDAAVIAKTPWLTARACDTIAIMVAQYRDLDVLQQVFEAIVRCFQREDQFPIQLTAVDALKLLVEEEHVASQVASQAPQLMGVLLNMAKTFESDVLTTVMEVFVEKFAANLEPYAVELTQRLVEQFLQMGRDMVDILSRNTDVDPEKELQAAGLLSTLTSLVISMGAAPEVVAQLEPQAKLPVLFVLENAMLLFLTDALELLESLVDAAPEMLPSMWELFDGCIAACDTFAHDYFDEFQPCYEAVMLRAFPHMDPTEQRVQALFTVCFEALNCNPVAPAFAHLAFEIMEFALLAMGKRAAPLVPSFLPQVYGAFQLLEAQDAFDGYFLHHLSIVRIYFACLCVDSAATLQGLEQSGFTQLFFKLWNKHTGHFQSVYGCKLQILAALAILVDVAPSSTYVPETATTLIANLEVLPHAVKARQAILDRESTNRDFEPGKDTEDDYEADDAELEAFKRTPLDRINVYLVFAERATMLQQQDEQKYLVVFGALLDLQKSVADRIIQIYLQQNQK